MHQDNVIKQHTIIAIITIEPIIVKVEGICIGSSMLPDLVVCHLKELAVAVSMCISLAIERIFVVTPISTNS